MLWMILTSVLLVSFLSLLGVFTLSINEKVMKKWLLYIVAFASGTLLGAAFFDLLPEAAESLGPTAFTYSLAGIVGFFIIERFIFWHHCHTHTHEIKPYTYLNLIGDGVHNFIDGAIIAAAFLTDTHLGIITTLAIALHEIPQELGDFAILVHGGLETNKALFYNFLSAITAVVGALLTYFLSSFVEGIIPILIAVAGGGFMYIATADLFPELHGERDLNKLVAQTILMVIGILLIWYLTGTISHGAEHRASCLV